MDVPSTSGLTVNPRKCLFPTNGWVRRRDSNPRPLAYGASELPTATTPRYGAGGVPPAKREKREKASRRSGWSWIQGLNL